MSAAIKFGINQRNFSPSTLSHHANVTELP